jgi:hypothetical protein
VPDIQLSRIILVKGYVRGQLSPSGIPRQTDQRISERMWNYCPAPDSYIYKKEGAGRLPVADRMEEFTPP